jgi:CubicO group peptidase (beta-lactamase class C family)
MVPELMQRFGVPGVAVGVLSDAGENVTTYGITCIDNPLPVQPTTLFQIGSITKTITATAIMRLVEQGRVELEAPIRRYLPDFRLADEDVAERATLRHLVTHTGGWVGDDFSDTGTGDDALERYVAGLAQLPQLTPLGALFSYCNSGFAVLGRIVEVVCGQLYEDAVRELVLEPLEMRHSLFMPSWIMTYRFAIGHLSPFGAEDEIRIARPWALTRASNSMGGLTTCIPDLLRYARFVLGRGPAGFMSDELRLRMQSPLAPSGNDTDWVGVSWFLRDIGNTRVVEHSGGTHGQTSTFKFVPERGFALAILTNSQRGSELHSELSTHLLEQHLGVAVRAPMPLDEVAPARLAEYAGHYDARLQSLDVSVDDDRLKVRINRKGGFPYKGAPPGPQPPPIHFACLSNDRIVGLEEPMRHARAEFVRDDQGRITWLRLGSRLAARQ